MAISTYYTYTCTRSYTSFRLTAGIGFFSFGIQYIYRYITIITNLYA